MRFDVIGGGPAGLYFAYLMKRSFPAYEIRVMEQNAADVTFGFGVALSDRALNFLTQTDQRVVDRLQRHMESWRDQHIVHRGHHVVIDGSAFYAIERLLLLRQLQALCSDLGVELVHCARIDGQGLQREADVIVGADGANSTVRDTLADEFGTEVRDLRNYFAWYGVQSRYDAHTLTFRATDDGVFCGHHYRYRPQMSTFVAEVDADTWQRSGMDQMTDEDRRLLMEQVFADALGDRPLVSNRSIWRRWRLVKNKRWFHQRTVLIGDALRTAHPSIGSGTRLAMEDATALWRAFTVEGTDIRAAFERFVLEREPVRNKLNQAAELSIAWYEQMAEKLPLPPYAFALDYLLRTKIVTPERLARESPAFWRCYTQSNLIAAT